MGTPEDSSWDTIVVGGGSAGAIVAGVLAQRFPSDKILLLEAGRDDRDLRTRVPLGLTQMMGNGAFDWMHESVPSGSQGGAVTKVPRGKMLGGSGSINSMLYVRGRATDYDRWAMEEGATGWSWDDVLPVFKRIERNHRLGKDDLHGDTGPMHIEDQASPHPLGNRFVEAGASLQIPTSTDFNGARQEGLGHYQCNMKRGERHTGVDAYLSPSRDKVAIRTHASVKRLTMDGTRATGVELEDGDLLTANRRVILCAGAIGTPTILMRSGIGPKGCVLERAGVGQNLQDHPAAPISFQSRRKGHGVALGNLGRMISAPFRYLAQREGMFASPTVEAGGFVRTDQSLAEPDVQFHFGPFNLGYWGHGYFADACVLNPFSRGHITLGEGGNPLIELNLLSDERDFDTLAAGWKLLRDILYSPAFGAVEDKLTSPGIDPFDDEAIGQWLRSTSFTSYHPVGTAKMGPESDPSAVVDPLTMKVHGAEALHVVDASVMPSLVAGNTNNPTMMIAQRAASELL